MFEFSSSAVLLQNEVTLSDSDLRAQLFAKQASSEAQVIQVTHQSVVPPVHTSEEDDQPKVNKFEFLHVRIIHMQYYHSIKREKILR